MSKGDRMDLDRLKSYTDSEGLMTVNQYPTRHSTGNGVLYSGLTAHLLENANHDNSSYIEAITNTEVSPGLYNRNKDRHDKNAWDDHIGASASSDFHAIRVWHHCKTHLGFFNNIEPNKKEWWAFHGRRPDIIAFYAISARSRLTPIAVLILKIAMLAASRINLSDSGILLRYLMLSRAIRKAKALKPVFEDFLKHVKDKYGGIGEVAKRYFGANHPLTEWINKL